MQLKNINELNEEQMGKNEKRLLNRYKGISFKTKERKMKRQKDYEYTKSNEKNTG